MDDDLLTPVLDERHDRVGFERPWQPWRLVFVSFFAGPFGAAYLFGMNFKKLGQRKRIRWSVLLFCVMGIVLGAFRAQEFIALTEEGLAKGEGPDLTTIGRVGTVLVAAGMAYVQSKRFHIFLYGNEEQSPLLWHALGALGINWVVGSGVMLAVTAVLQAN